MKILKKERLDISVLALAAANAIPFVGVIFLGWDAFFIVLLYWSENLVIGLYNILKIAFASVPHPISHLGKLFLISFFAAHYGAFTAVHGIFVLAIFNKSIDFEPVQGKSWPCIFVFLQMLINVAKNMYSIIPSQMKFAVAALFLSHGLSFVYNYIGKGEYLTAKGQNLMAAPYGRVIVMHVTILAGGFLAMALGSPAALLTVLVILKTIVDIKFHLRSHKKAQPETDD
jgi:hypothetical protein